MAALNRESEALAHGNRQSSEQTPALATAELDQCNLLGTGLDQVSALHACLENGAEPHP